MEKIYKSYTDEECLKHLISKAKEELSDVISYNQMYESLKLKGLYDDAMDIEHIANQEYGHAKIIFDLLEERDYNVYDDSEIAALIEKVEEIFD